MNKIILMAIAFCSILFSCTPEPKVKISFCTSPNAQGTCQGKEDTFPLQKIYVSCRSTTPFDTKKISGTVYALKEGEKIFLGSQDFALEPGQQEVTHSIPFNEFGERGMGEFLVEFVNEKNELLAEKLIRITR